MHMGSNDMKNTKKAPKNTPKGQKCRKNGEQKQKSACFPSQITSTWGGGCRRGWGPGTHYRTRPWPCPQPWVAGDQPASFGDAGVRGGLHAMNRGVLRLEGPPQVNGACFPPNKVGGWGSGGQYDPLWWWGVRGGDLGTQRSLMAHRCCRKHLEKRWGGMGRPG